ncbi:hypothetical protein Pst134EA_030392 [Puccinia striiformis f. sp. tritici]|uniref:hypothetical protein n=1 Tax=Puccinia striiformis f. sp. tritici TaxID=168172 RepID=UPI0020082FB8|nr:hypothetical protein Pst134EA_030392 [Puccinia striiformis f. sp. tritici]KAH9446474.1 hypothetical protein Pst134EA_030392 [Puccinia striiformis f. sp. tritici]
MSNRASFIAFLCVALGLMVAEMEVIGAPLTQQDIVVTLAFHELRPLRRRGSLNKVLLARSPQEKQGAEKEDKKAENEAGKESAKIIRKAASALFKATKNVDRAILILQNPASTAEEIKKAAEDAIKNEDAEDFPRQALASAARDPEAAQGALAIIRDKGPVVVGALKEIHRNSGDQAKVQEELAKVTLARLQVVPANFALMGGVAGGNRRLISTVAISPSQKAIGTSITDPTQKKVVEEQQANLASQTKTVDEQVAIIQKEGTTPEEIEQAAKKALVQEAGEEFAREVLASAASDAKAAMTALGEVRDNGPSKVVAGFKAIEANAKDAAAVKKGIDLVVEGRKHVVPANLKLIELSKGSSNAAAPATAAAAAAPAAAAPATAGAAPPAAAPAEANKDSTKA